MHLVDLALEAHAHGEDQRRERDGSDLRQRAERVRGLVDLVFGVPFAEAFDVSKVEVASDGTLVVDGYLHLSENDEGELVVSAYHRTTHRHVGRKAFRSWGPGWQDINLVNLGGLLLWSTIDFTEAYAA